MKAQLESEPKETATKEAGLVEDTTEDEDPVEKALAKYGIICENPWEKGVK